MHYLDYIVPGMLASTVVQVAFGESTWPMMSKFQWIRIYHAMHATPLRIVDIVGGELLFLLLRCSPGDRLPRRDGRCSARCTRGGRWPWSRSAGCSARRSSRRCWPSPATSSNDNMFAADYRFVVIPMTLFAGVFFPIAKLPAPVRWLAYVSPLWHGVRAVPGGHARLAG